MTLPVAVLAGGLAKRLHPLTMQTPKSLVEVAGRPFAAHQIELLARNGVTRIVFCLGYLGTQIADALGNGQRWGVSINYVDDGPLALGTGGAVRRARSLLGPEFAVLYGDSYLDCDYRDVERAFRRSCRLGLMTVFRNDSRWDRSNVRFENGEIVTYDKSRPSPEMRHIDYGLNVFRSEAFDPYPDAQAFDLSQVQRDLLANDQLAAYEVQQRFYEIGSPEGLAETERHLARALPNR